MLLAGGGMDHPGGQCSIRLRVVFNPRQFVTARLSLQLILDFCRIGLRRVLVECQDPQGAVDLGERRTFAGEVLRKSFLHIVADADVKLAALALQDIDVPRFHLNASPSG